MTLHIEHNERPVTVKSGDEVFCLGLGHTAITQCQRCGFKTGEYYHWEHVYICEHCYSEIHERIGKALDRSFV